MLLLKLLLLILLLIGCGVGPGLLVLRPLRWTPMERLAAGPAISFTLIGLLSFVLFLTNAPAGWYWTCSAIATLCTIIAIPDIRRLLASSTVRRALFAWGLLIAALLVDLLLIRVYEGANWWGDWFEHAERTQVFLHLLPLNYSFLDTFTLSARPPMMNLLAAYFCAQVGFRFELFSIVLIGGSLWAFLPCCLMLRHLNRRGMRAVFLLAALLMLNPCFVVNALYTWTKLAAVGFAILSLSMYLAAIRDNKSSKVIGAIAFMAAGLLVHYSILPYALILLAHYLYLTIRGDRRRWAMEWAAGVVATVLILGSWIFWTWHRFGAGDALASNSTVGAMKQRSFASSITLFGANFIDMLVPHPLRGLPMPDYITAPFWSFCRDYLFVMYENNFLTMIGTVSWAAALWLTVRALRNRRVDPAARTLWLLFICLSIPLCVALTPGRDYNGASYLAMQTLSTLALCVLAARFDRLPWPLRWGVVVGCAFDFLGGVALEIIIESIPFHARQIDARHYVYDLYPVLSYTARSNWTQKLRYHFTFWGDHVAGAAPALRAMMLLIGAIAIGLIAWHAWNVPAAIGRRKTMRAHRQDASSIVG